MKTILVVEDEDDIARILQLLLQQNGYKVIRVADGLSAVSAAQKHLPDLMILDIMLPGGDGVSVLDRVRQSFNTNAIPVVILTSLQDTKLKTKLEGLGIDSFINKPYENDMLISKIEEIIG